MLRTSTVLITSIICMVFISGCTQTQTGQLITDAKSDEIKKPLIGTKEGAERIAVEFSVAMSNQNYDDVYDLLLPGIQNLYTPKEFSGIIYDEFKDIDFIYDKTVLANDNGAYAYYKAKSGMLETSMEPIKLEFYNEEWKVNALAGLSYDIQYKKESEAELSKYKYFFKIGEEANNGEDSVKIISVETANSINDKYGEKRPSKVNNTFLIIVAETVGYPFFGDCVYGYDESNIVRNQYLSSTKDCCKKLLLFMDESLFNRYTDSSGGEKVTGMVAYEVPSQIKEFVVPFENFYWDRYKKEHVGIYFIVNL